MWVRLGFEEVEPQYYESIKSLFDIKYCVGIMGGKKNKALYFVGYEGNSLIFLDPHYVNDAIKRSELENFDVSTYTCKIPKKLAFSSLDPCLSVGFLVKSADEFISLKNDLKKLKEDFKDASIVSLY